MATPLMATLLRARVFRSSALIAFTLLFAIPRLVTERAGWPTDSVAAGQLAAMAAGSALTPDFATLSPRLGRTNVRAVRFTAGVVATAAATFRPQRAITLLTAISLAFFSPTSANGTRALEAASAVPGRQRPTAIGLFAYTYLMGGALGPTLAIPLILRQHPAVSGTPTPPPQKR
ncbi:hypothetical protein ACH4UV_38630 [Streptomyces sp. NPDC020802]|uniref:hypothetical protein n=1 Tax=Streptomyces sp. NPDC020802 TaxID=3365094 RepID=UPI0037ADB201